MIPMWNEFEWREESLGDYLISEQMIITHCFTLVGFDIFIKADYGFAIRYPFDPDADAEFDYWYDTIYEKCPHRNTPESYIDEFELYNLWNKQPELHGKYDLEAARVLNTQKTEFCNIAEPDECSECCMTTCPENE